MILFAPIVLLVVSLAGLSLSIVLLLLLLACSALISGAEVAYFSLSPADLHLLANEGSTNSKRILQLRENPRMLLATILISNNFVNIAIVILSDFIIRSIFSQATFLDWAAGMPSFFHDNFSDNVLAKAIEFTLTVVGATFLLVLFGEVAPKIYANINNKKMARMMAGPLIFLKTFFSPISRILVNWSSRFEDRLAHDTVRSRNRKDDLDKAIELTVSHELNSEKEIDILKSIVKFGDVSVKQIMRSRVDVVAIDINSKFDEVLRTVNESGYSRIPVYEDDFDNIKGILYVKDLLLHLNKGEQFVWKNLIRHDVKYVPEAKKINELLTEFQQERTHMAIVVDEFGGSGGLVTLEDVMEEVIGDIRDEFDEEIEVEYEKIDDFNYVFEGKTLLNDLCRVIGVSTDTFEEVREADSVAGLILELLGKIPRKNIEIKYKEYRFKILAVSTKRIEKVKITLPNEDKS
ncbi:MAG: gliding motility-associated protein GldE [Saprospiraceae bacterium]|nr:gliding motility-associated protein GldE [Saprospiraceae bacterium]